MAIKIQKSNVKINPFIGISFIQDCFINKKLSELIDNELGNRVESYGYSYSDIIKNLFSIYYCGGDCIEDIQTHFGDFLKDIPNNSVPSSDTILRGIKELSVENSCFKSNSGKEYDFNINSSLNLLNIKILLKTKQLVKGNYYDFDYDNQIISTEKYDAKRTYKNDKGYFPAVGSIEDKIVYIENRDGNANVKFEQAATLTRAYDLLSKQDIKVNRSRMDAGSYSKEIIDVVSANSKLFYIRANKCESLLQQVSLVDNWESIEMNYKDYQVASIKFTQFYEDRNYRLVVMRCKNKSGQINMFTQDDYIYRFLLTNDWDNSEKDIIEFYNQRGTSEKLFDVMNNDFGWNHLPCSFMKENTVFLILTAMAKNFYNYIVKKVAIVFDDISPTTRLKRFIFKFISVAGKWIYSGRQWILKLFTNRPYEQIKFA